MRMKAQVKRKLSSQAGESITETLVALLIAAFALIMLAGALTASSGVVTKSRNAIDSYQSDIEDMITESETATSGEVTFSESGSSGVKLEIPSEPVSYYETSFGNTSVGFYKKSGT